VRVRLKVALVRKGLELKTKHNKRMWVVGIAGSGEKVGGEGKK
jgi:hypothetical protein